MGVYLWTDSWTLTYDFTQSDWGWTAGSGTSRNSSWFYRSWTWTDGYILAPLEVYNSTPKKIILTYNKTVANSGTWFTNNIPWVQNYYSVTFPYDSNSTIYSEYADWVSNIVDLGSNPTWIVDWVATIDSSTSNWTVKHKIWSLNEVTDTSWVMKYLWDNNEFAVRIVNWTWTIYITWLTIEY